MVRHKGVILRKISELDKKYQDFILKTVLLNNENSVNSAVEALKRKRKTKVWHIEVLQGEIVTIDKVIREISTTTEEKRKK